ncbi:MAG: hypothetical protein DIU80_014160 [Chloroflexota bacterium]
MDNAWQSSYAEHTEYHRKQTLDGSGLIFRQLSGASVYVAGVQRGAGARVTVKHFATLAAAKAWADELLRAPLRDRAASSPRA